MKKTSRFISAALSAALTCSMLTAPSAASSDKYKLVTKDLYELGYSLSMIEGLGDHLYLTRSYNWDGSAVFRLTDCALTEWRCGGDLTVEKIEVENYTGEGLIMFFPDMPFSEGQYAFAMMETINEILKYDEEGAKLLNTYSSRNELGVTSDGYILENNYRSGSDPDELTIIDPDGNVVKEVSYSDIRTFLGGFAAAEYNDEHGIKAIDKTGKETIVVKKSGGLYVKCTDYLAFFETDGKTIGIYNAKTNKLYHTKLPYSYTDKKGDEYKFDYLGYTANGEQVIARYYCGDFLGNSDNIYQYSVFDLKKDKFITDKYLMITTLDNCETFRAVGEDGKVRIINSKGKILGTFDKAGEFCSDSKYAPVIKDGELYLIDKDMKRVSEKIKVNENVTVLSLGNDVYAYGEYEEYYYFCFTGSPTLFTYSDEKPACPTLSAKKTDSTVKLSWSKAAGAEKYEIQYSTDGGKTYKDAVMLSAAKKKHNIKINPKKTYKFRIRSVRTADGNTYYSKWSKPVTVK